MPLIDPLRLDRAQRGLFEVFSDALAPATVAWVYGQPSFETVGSSLVTLQLVGGPTPFSRKGARGRLLRPFDSITIRIIHATVGVRDLLMVNGFSFFHDVVGGDTPETVRDALVVALNADPEDPWMAAPGVPVNELVLTPDSFGSIFSLELVGGLEAVSQVQSGDAVLFTEGTRTFTLGIQAYSKGREPRNGAWGLISQAESVFEAEDYIDQLCEAGISVWDKGVAADISAIAGANWETRVSIDVTLAMRSNLIRPVDQIEDVTLILNVSDALNVVATQTITVTDPTP